MNTQETTNLDLRTLLLVMMEDDVPRERIFSLIAKEMDVPVEQLVSALTITPADNSRQYHKWTEERLNELVERWNAGQKPSHIAREMGITVQVVYQRLTNLRKVRTDIKSRIKNANLR